MTFKICGDKLNRINITSGQVFSHILLYETIYIFFKYLYITLIIRYNILILISLLSIINHYALFFNFTKIYLTICALYL